MGGGPHAMPRELWDQLHELIGHCQTKWREQMTMAPSHGADGRSSPQGPTTSERKATDTQPTQVGEENEDEDEEEGEEEGGERFKLDLQPVERIRRPSMERFLRDYMQKGIPVIITGTTHHSALHDAHRRDGISAESVHIPIAQAAWTVGRP
jgi:hypothetical protein